jgi:hypothetical protein
VPFCIVQNQSESSDDEEGTYRLSQLRNLLIVDLSTELENAINVEIENCAIELPIEIDTVYNLIVCKDCGIGVPLERVSNHLRYNHKIKATAEQAMTYLNLDRAPMTVAQAKDWIKRVWVGSAVQNISVMKGYKCKECEYSTPKMSVMRIHFSKQHRGLKVSENSEKCKIQMLFKGGLQKYIQIAEDEDDEMDVDHESECEWKMTIDKEFEESIANVKVSGAKAHGNLRLMNVFIAKTRWDVVIEGKDLKAIVDIAGPPPISSSLHKVILCGRRYIKNTCEALDKGSIIVKRLLMSEGYCEHSEYF